MRARESVPEAREAEEHACFKRRECTQEACLAPLTAWKEAFHEATVREAFSHADSHAEGLLVGALVALSRRIIFKWEADSRLSLGCVSRFKRDPGGRQG